MFCQEFFLIQRNVTHVHIHSYKDRKGLSLKLLFHDFLDEII
jgi:hypothetical protein